MHKHKFVPFLTVLIVLCIFMTLSLVVLETNHDCSGDDCPICEIIRTGEDFRKLVVAFFSLVGLLLVIVCGDIFSSHKVIYIEKKLSLISLRVKLSS